MTPQPTSTDASAQLEELVAYLDGELDAAAARRVEERLAGDAAYRRELARLERAWDCLEALPQTTVDESFTRSTIEMVTQAAADDVRRDEATLPARRRARWVIAAASGLAALLVGFFATAAWW